MHMHFLFHQIYDLLIVNFIYIEKYSGLYSGKLMKGNAFFYDSINVSLCAGSYEYFSENTKRFHIISNQERV